MVLYTTLKSNGNSFMELTNIEGIELLQCITMFTEVASKLSGKLHSFCDSTLKIENVTVKNYLNDSLLSLCFIIYGQGSFEKSLM